MLVHSFVQILKDRGLLAAVKIAELAYTPRCRRKIQISSAKRAVEGGGLTFRSNAIHHFPLNYAKSRMIAKSLGICGSAE
jgi:hypothetical protein